MRIYLSHPIRGVKGKDATIQEMLENNQKAIEFGAKYRKTFPHKIYVPAEHDEFVIIAYQKGYLTEEQILDIDCEILQSCEGVVFYNHELVMSGGMNTEFRCATNLKIPMAFISKWDEGTIKILELLHKQIYETIID
jgi:hypothetical protein